MSESTTETKADESKETEATSTATETKSETTDTTGDDFDKERALSTIRAQREKENQLKAELKELKEKADRLDKIEADKLSEQEKLAKRAADAEAKIADAEAKLKRANLLVELSKPDHGIVSAAAAAKLLDGVEYDADGRPANLAEILPAFLDENPFLKGEPPKQKASNINADDGRAGGTPPTLTSDELTYAKAFGMTPEEYVKFKEKNPKME